MRWSLSLSLLFLSACLAGCGGGSSSSSVGPPPPTSTTPSITSLSPTSGPVGTAVAITGANFGSTQGSSTVTFNGTVASPTSWSDASIVAPVPAGATTGNVVVTVNGVASNGVSFTVRSAVSLYVTFPPTDPSHPYYNDVQTYLLHNNVAAGASVDLQWSDVDQGPSASPQYDWTAFDSSIQPWIQAGKTVNLLVWAVSDNPVNAATPAYVWTDLGPANITTCGGQQIPNYFNSAFQTPYREFMAEVIQHYGNNTSIGYIRFGLGRGDETLPGLGFGTEPTCTTTFETNWGWTATSWLNYLDSMLSYEATLKSPKQIMVGLDSTNYFPTDQEVTVAATAVAAQFGIGSQGLQKSDLTNYPNCTSDWCNLFNEYTGEVPLELQTFQVTDPTGASQTGSLVDLIPFAVQHHATILEVLWQDWLLAYDPNYPGNSQYGASYAQVLQAAAGVSGP